MAEAYLYFLQIKMEEFLDRINALSSNQRKLLALRLKREGLDINMGILPKTSSIYPPITPLEKKEYYHLSSVQRRLLALDKLDQGSTIYHVSSMKKIKGPLTKKKIKKIFKTLINRHESFRTAFEFINGEPIQRIRNHVEFDIKYYDISKNKSVADKNITKAPHSTPQESNSETSLLMSNALKNLITPFNLEHPPLIHVGLIKFGEQNHYILVDMHHIISDALSESILWKEYFDISANKYLEPLYIQYKDYSHWQNSFQVKKRLELQKKYWLNEFNGELPLINLPIDFERPINKSTEGAYRYFKINREESKELKELAIQENTTLFIVLLTVYYIFLSKISRQEDIVVGIPVAGRKHPGLNKIIGMFVNTLALRNFPRNNKNFIEFLKQIRQKTIVSFENQDFPFEDLVNLKIKKRDSSRNPIFDVFFGFKAPGISNDMPKIFISDDPSELQLDEESPPEGTLNSMFDLYFYGMEIKDELYFGFTYSTALFKKQTIVRFINYIKEIVSAIVKNRMIKLKDISISHHLAIARPKIFQDDVGDFDF